MATLLPLGPQDIEVDEHRNGRMIALNGLMLSLVRFILAHGPVELSVICLAGAAGTALGESLIRPSAPTRAQSFRACAAHLGPLLVACVLLLLGAGLLEGFISPSADSPYRCDSPSVSVTGF